MNAIKLLGSLMGNQSLSSGIGGKLLGGLLGGGGQQPQQQSGGGLAGILSGVLGGGGGQQQQSGGGLTDLLGSVMGGGGNSGGGGIGGMLGSVLGGGQQEAQQQVQVAPENQAANDQATLLIRAMVNAAKSDGRIDEAEQKNILEKVGSDVSPAEIEFLQNEFKAPLDVASFAQSVPSGLEQQIYAVSLTSIELDTQNEAQYLGQLAQGLKLDPNLCNQIHDQLGVPKIFG